MPKQKTHSATKKRFKLTGTGKLARRRRLRTKPPGHLVKHGKAKRKRVRQAEPVAPSDQKAVRKLLGRGYWGLKHSSYKRAKEQVDKSLVYAYRDRKNKKRTFRRLWIMRINAAARREGLSYNQLVAGLRKAEIPQDRKVRADLAVSDPEAFGKIAEQAKAALQS